MLARYVGPRLTTWIETELQGRFALTINRDKTRVLRLAEAGASLNFLGYTFRYDRDRWRRGHRYLNLFPSHAAVARERQALRALTGARQCCQPIPTVIAAVNQQLQGWANYFGQGYPRHAFRKINAFVWQRLKAHLQRRSQRPYRPPQGVTYYAQLQRLGLRLL